MRWSGIYVDAAAAAFDGLETVGEAIAAGRYGAEEAARSRQRSVAVSRGRGGPDLAVEAGRAAMRLSRRSPAEVGLLVHASCWFPGLDFWNVASYLQHQIIGHGEVVAFELRQMSNGGMSALELAAGQLTARRDVDAAMSTLR